MKTAAALTVVLLLALPATGLAMGGYTGAPNPFAVVDGQSNKAANEELAQKWEAFGATGAAAAIRSSPDFISEFYGPSSKK